MGNDDSLSWVRHDSHGPLLASTRGRSGNAIRRCADDCGYHQRKMNISYRTTDDPPGVVIKDHIKQRQIQVLADRAVSPVSIDTDSFKYPVDEAFTIVAERLRLTQSPSVYLRSADGVYDQMIDTQNTVFLEQGSYSLDFAAPLKIYWYFDGSAEISRGIDTFSLEFAESTEVKFGIRSNHKKPPGKITTTGSPDDLMTVLGALSSSLKTTSCERSFPTLRGYPPLIELGAELDIPNELKRPDTGIRIAVPPEHEYLYPAAPLAFYLGAELVPANNPRLLTDDFEHSLKTGRAFENEVAKILKQVLFLDCVVRTEGLYQVELHERKQIEDDLPFDITETYESDLAEQLPLYLDVPFETVEPLLPRWCLTAHLPPVLESVEAIPHIVNDLGIIRKPVSREKTVPRTVNQGTVRNTTVQQEARSGNGSSQSMELTQPVPSDESIEHAWFGDGTPLGASKASVESFENQLRDIERNESIDITVVCNDPNMIDEQMLLDGVYGDREDYPYSVRSHFGVTRDELVDILTGERRDLLHYIGHATPEGIECTDGKLDVRELESVSVNAFLLNACRSFEQAEALVEKGSFGGVATLGDVVNNDAIDIGKAIAHFLNLGFPLRATVELVQKHTSIGSQYLIVGDGSLDIVQPDAGAPMISRVEPKDDGTFELTIQLFPTKHHQVGTVVSPSVDGITEHYIHPRTIEANRINQNQLTEFLTWSNYPFEIDGTINWNETLGVVLFDE
ncbi:hypothetical protein [Haloarchaeobius sp. DT45]|uniref:hypothetical protein n=1 Tax=Haloarchaeobius sp. DT45 TaxID=3446116 RepID=UPI003F6C7981